MQYDSSAKQVSYGQASNTYATPAQPPSQPTRFSTYAGQLEARVAHMTGLIERFSRVADRLGGSVPEEAQTSGKLRGGGGCIASQIENSLEDFDALTRRAERTAERLETL